MGWGSIVGTKRVDPSEWFFAAHFFQDPVCPGSLGLESFQQLLKVVAARRWGVDPGTRFESVGLGDLHRWTYRGQILPTDAPGDRPGRGHGGRRRPDDGSRPTGSSTSTAG